MPPYDDVEDWRPVELPKPPSLAGLRRSVVDGDGPELAAEITQALLTYNVSTVADQIVIGLHRRDRETADMAENNYGG